MITRTFLRLLHTYLSGHVKAAGTLANVPWHTYVGQYRSLTLIYLAWMCSKVEAPESSGNGAKINLKLPDLTLRVNHAVWMFKHLVNQRLTWQWKSLTTVMDLSFGCRDSSTIYAALSQANVPCHMYAPGELLHHVQIQQKITEFRTSVFLKINFLLKKKKKSAAGKQSYETSFR